MFDLLFEAPSYRPVYVISDSEMNELKKNQHQEELDEIKTQKIRMFLPFSWVICAAISFAYINSHLINT